MVKIKRAAATIDDTSLFLLSRLSRCHACHASIAADVKYLYSQQSTTSAVYHPLSKKNLFPAYGKFAPCLEKIFFLRIALVARSAAPPLAGKNN
jgi:hypothetical protein